MNEKNDFALVRRPASAIEKAASGAKRLLLTHRPHELPLENGLELARDGLVLEL